MTRRHQRAAAGAAALTLVAALGACADQGGADQSGGDGIAQGATMEEYQAAFADVDQITLFTQSPAPEGSPVGKNFEDYYAAIEEWSDGKITFDISWANAVAAAPEADEALADGRLDVGSVMAAYDPDVFPTYAALADTSYMGNGNPLEMILTPHGYITDIAMSSDALDEEFSARGLHVLAPAFTGGINGLFCADERRTLDELKGAEVRISGGAHSAEAQALGMSPVSMEYAEVYEALQRGVLDCAFAGATVVELGDLLSVAPHAVLSSTTSFGQVPSVLAISETAWERLPLVAQQLLHDRADVFVESNMRGLLDIFETVLADVPANGGVVAGLDDEALAALDRGNEDFLESVAADDDVVDGATLVDQITEKSEEWRARVGEMGYDTEVDYDEFATWLGENDVDLKPYMDAIRTLLAENRPA